MRGHQVAVMAEPNDKYRAKCFTCGWKSPLYSYQGNAIRACESHEKAFSEAARMTPHKTAVIAESNSTERFRATCLTCGWHSAYYSLDPGDAMRACESHQVRVRASERLQAEAEAATKEAAPVIPHKTTIKEEHNTYDNYNETRYKAKCLTCGWQSLHFDQGAALRACESHQVRVLREAEAVKEAAAFGAEFPSEKYKPVHRPIPTWDGVIAVLDAAGYDTRQWKAEIERSLVAHFIKVAGDLLDEMDIDPVGEYHTDVQRHALVDTLVQVAVRALQGARQAKPLDIDLRAIMTNDRFKQIFEGTES